MASRAQPQVRTAAWYTHLMVRNATGAIPVPPNVFREKCPSRVVLERVADRWSALLIYALSSGTRRYSDLHKTVDGISQKMLTQTLRNLERDGLVLRKAYPVIPPKVEYSLSPLGATLVGPLRAICQWAEAHVGEILDAREKHPRRTRERAR
jgi:DNA-binding HxlR family transcriptional regulator